MKLAVNSEPREFSGQYISELAAELNLPAANGIALAVNEKVVPKSEWDNFKLNNNDNVLIIKATQGG